MKTLIQPIAEFVIRLFSKSPKFFRVIQWLIFIITAALGILTAAQTDGLFIPAPWIDQFLGGDSVLMGVLAYIIAKLPVENATTKDAKVNNVLNK